MAGFPLHWLLPRQEPAPARDPPWPRPNALPASLLPHRPSRPRPRRHSAGCTPPRFLTTAAQLDQLPALDVPEIAFVGRSNAGKSTCINTLTQQRQLAFASKTPGRTQHINLFALGRQNQTDAVLADLPGYGYAQVPLADKVRWQRVMANYLMNAREPGRRGAAVRPAPRPHRAG